MTIEQATTPVERVSLMLTPVTLREARFFVSEQHRHHRAPQGGIFAIAVADWLRIPTTGDELPGRIRGVAIVGRPVGRGLQDGYTADVTRMCTDGAPNACSMLYGAAWRACRAMGYRRLVTYTLEHEGGGSLRGAGFRIVNEVPGRSWSCPSRPRVDTEPHQNKLRWEITL